MKTNNTLVMRRPASWGGNPMREATPLGSGTVGAMVSGGVGEERILVNRADCWHHGPYRPVPDVADCLPEVRALQDAGNYGDACHRMYDELKSRGFSSPAGCPLSLGELRLTFAAETLFTGYRRLLHMERGESEIRYTQHDRRTVRRCFVSRRDDVLYYTFSSTEPTAVTVSFDFYDDGTGAVKTVREDFKKSPSATVSEQGILFYARSDTNEFAVAVSVFADGVSVRDNALVFTATDFTLSVKTLTGKGSIRRIALQTPFDYAAKLRSHVSLHKRLYAAADLSFGKAKNRTNEDLLDEAYEKEADRELLEKMWRFGRYLFISGTKKGGLPFPLYGLWQTELFAEWAQHVANENVEIIHWHTEVGGLSDLVKPLIDYYCSDLAPYRDMAKNLYGCRGIFVDVYSSPINKGLCEFVPVILHFTGCAAWLSEHFYRYYRMTGDRKTLTEKIFPFMLAAADFYMDYITFDQNGQVKLYPSVSPENTPLNLMDVGVEYLGHPCPAVKNATIEIALVKELFTEILDLIAETDRHHEYEKPLKKYLSEMPPYRIGADGAVKEWLDDDLTDNHFHRHISHLYPVFPAREVTEKTDPVLFAAFRKALDARELGGQSGWSLSHTASVYAAFGCGEEVIECLDTLLKGCTLANFMTLHNDYRNMGVTLTWDKPPVQLDANMGAVNALQKAVFDQYGDTVALLPALPKRLGKGSFKGFCYAGGKVDCRWNADQQSFTAVVYAKRSGTLTLRLPPFAGSKVLVDGKPITAEDGKIRLTVTAPCRLTVTGMPE